MAKKGIQRALDFARQKVKEAISGNARSDLAYGSGAMAGEGYNGGYLAALNDVDQAMNGAPPLHSRFWPSPNTPQQSSEHEAPVCSYCGNKVGSIWDCCEKCDESRR